MFSQEQNEISIKEEPAEEYNHIFIKEEFSDENAIKSEPCELYNQIFIKEEFLEPECVIKIEKELNDENTYRSEKEIFIENKIQFEENFGFDSVHPENVEPVYAKANKLVCEVNPEFIIPDLIVNVNGAQLETDQNKTESELNDDINNDPAEEEQKEESELERKRSTDWLAHSLLYCPNCKTKIKKLRRDKFKFCPDCKIKYLYQCSLCEKNYKQCNRLSHHLKYYCTSEKRNFTCKQCSYQTKDPSILKDHVKYVHCDDQRISCSICRKIFKSHRCLQSHIRYIHEKSMMQCEHCCYRTRSKNTLIKHLTCHSDTPKNKLKEELSESSKVSCQICQKTLKNKRTLKAHVKYCHERLMLECEYCLFVTKFKSYLMKHMATFHPNVVSGGSKTEDD